MALQDTDLFLVQRGSVPYKDTTANLSKKIRGDLDVTASGDIPIASASQLGVIRVGNNLQIDAGTGVMDAVIPAGLEFQGLWGDAANSPSTSGIVIGNFWIWNGGDGVTLTGPTWSAIQNQTLDNRDRVVWSAANNWAIVRDSSGSGGITAVTGTSPIKVDSVTDPDQPDVSIQEATASQDGYMTSTLFNKLNGIDPGANVNVDPTQTYTAAASGGTLTLSPGGNLTAIPDATKTEAGLMSAADKTTFDTLVSSGGVVSVTAGSNITMTGTTSAPVVNVTANSFVPYNISTLGVLP